MLIREIIKASTMNESVELSSTLRSIASEIGNPVTTVYDKMNDAAQKWSENHDSMDTFGFMEKNISSRWYNEHGSDLVSELHHLVDQAPSQASSALRRFLRDENSSDFSKLATMVTPILIQIGKDTGYEHLVRNAAAWQRQEQEYRQNLEKLGKYASSSSKRPKDQSSAYASMSPTRGEKVDQAAADRRALQATQKVQIERLVNTVLSSLPRGVAGEIRNAIAKDPNKLVALQRELSKRDIKI